MKSRLAVLKKDRMEDEGFPEPGVDLALRARLRRSLQVMMIGMQSWSRVPPAAPASANNAQQTAVYAAGRGARLLARPGTCFILQSRGDLKRRPMAWGLAQTGRSRVSFSNEYARPSTGALF